MNYQYIVYYIEKVDNNNNVYILDILKSKSYLFIFFSIVQNSDKKWVFCFCIYEIFEVHFVALHIFLDSTELYICIQNKDREKRKDCEYFFREINISRNF